MPDDITQYYMQSGKFPATPTEQAQVIEQLKAMQASRDPVQRDLADRFQKKFGSTPLGVGINAATGGLSDKLMTKGAFGRYSDPALAPLSTGDFQIYEPGELDFARLLSSQLTPNQDAVAKGVGTAMPVGLAMRIYRMIQNARGGPPGPRGGPPPPAPLSPAGSGPAPGQLPPSGQGTPSPVPEGPFGPPPPVPEGPFGPSMPSSRDAAGGYQAARPGLAPTTPPMSAGGYLPDISVPADFAATPLGFTSPFGGGGRYSAPPVATARPQPLADLPPRHPAGATDKKGNKIGGQFTAD